MRTTPIEIKNVLHPVYQSLFRMDEYTINPLNRVSPTVRKRYRNLDRSDVAVVSYWVRVVDR